MLHPVLVLIWEYSARAIRLIPIWQGLDELQNSLRSCALAKSSHSVRRVRELTLLLERFSLSLRVGRARWWSYYCFLYRESAPGEPGASPYWSHRSSSSSYAWKTRIYYLLSLRVGRVRWWSYYCFLYRESAPEEPGAWLYWSHRSSSSSYDWKEHKNSFFISFSFIQHNKKTFFIHQFLGKDLP